MFPSNLESTTYPDPTDINKSLVRPEVERRKVYFDDLERMMPESFVHLVKNCLQNDPSKRPKAEQLVSSLQSLITEGKHINITYQRGRNKI